VSKPAWTEKVERGMWLIVARSATVMAAELGDTFLGKEDTEAVLAASRYADHHWSKHRRSGSPDLSENENQEEAIA
jgi:hypothetical protein